MKKMLKTFTFTAAAVLCVGLAHAGADCGVASAAEPTTGGHETAVLAMSSLASEPGAGMTARVSVPQMPEASVAFLKATSSNSAPGEAPGDNWCRIIVLIMCCHIDGETLCGPRVVTPDGR